MNVNEIILNYQLNRCGLPTGQQYKMSFLSGHAWSCRVQFANDAQFINEIYEALFNKPNFKRAQTANSIKFINVMFISLHTGQKKKQFAFHLESTINDWLPFKTFNHHDENAKKKRIFHSPN